jgi:hypothetical protein
MVAPIVETVNKKEFQESKAQPAAIWGIHASSFF